MRQFRAIAPVLVLLAGLAVEPAVGRAETYLSPRDFLERSFDGAVPAPSILWIDRSLKARMKARLGRTYPGLRVRFWARDGRSAWVLDAIGRYEPITAGFVVDHGRIARVSVLIYRESHGWEVRHPFFTDRFTGAELDRDGGLTRDVDNISGATLSVNALKWLGRLALLLHDAALPPGVGDPAGKQ